MIKLRNVLPNFASYHKTDQRAIYAIDLGELFMGISAGCIRHSYLLDLFAGKFSKAVSFPGGFSFSSFVPHVPHVISLGSQEQVGGIDTGRVVTTVADKRVSRFAIMQRVRKAMSVNVLPVPDKEPAVSSILVGRPQPTSIGVWPFINFFPKERNPFFTKHGETPKYKSPFVVGESRQRPDHKGRKVLYLISRLWRDFINYSTEVLLHNQQSAQTIAIPPFSTWGEDVWRPVCAANPQIVDCRVIYPGDVLGIPK